MAKIKEMIDIIFSTQNQDTIDNALEVLEDISNIEEVANVLIEFFQKSDQIAKSKNSKGLWDIFQFSFSSILENLCNLNKIEKAKNLLESLEYLYKGYFNTALYFDEKFINFNKSFGLAGDTCYMLWDLIIIPELLLEKALEILERLIKYPTLLTQLSALHGLGHLAHGEANKNYYFKCCTIIKKYLLECKNDSLKKYAQNALTGKI